MSTASAEGARLKAHALRLPLRAEASLQWLALGGVAFIGAMAASHGDHTLMLRPGLLGALIWGSMVAAHAWWGGERPLLWGAVGIWCLAFVAWMPPNDILFEEWVVGAPWHPMNRPSAAPWFILLALFIAGTRPQAGIVTRRDIAVFGAACVLPVLLVQSRAFSAVHVSPGVVPLLGYLLCIWNWRSRFRAPRFCIAAVILLAAQAFEDRAIAAACRAPIEAALAVAEFCHETDAIYMLLPGTPLDELLLGADSLIIVATAATDPIRFTALGEDLASLALLLLFLCSAILPRRRLVRIAAVLLCGAVWTYFLVLVETAHFAVARPWLALALEGGSASGCLTLLATLVAFAAVAADETREHRLAPFGAAWRLPLAILLVSVAGPVFLWAGYLPVRERHGLPDAWINNAMEPRNVRDLERMLRDFPGAAEALERGRDLLRQLMDADAEGRPLERVASLLWELRDTTWQLRGAFRRMHRGEAEAAELVLLSIELESWMAHLRGAIYFPELDGTLRWIAEAVRDLRHYERRAHLANVALQLRSLRLPPESWLAQGFHLPPEGRLRDRAGGLPRFATAVSVLSLRALRFPIQWNHIDTCNEYYFAKATSYYFLFWEATGRRPRSPQEVIDKYGYVCPARVVDYLSVPFEDYLSYNELSERGAVSVAWHMPMRHEMAGRVPNLSLLSKSFIYLVRRGDSPGEEPVEPPEGAVDVGADQTGEGEPREP